MCSTAQPPFCWVAVVFNCVTVTFKTIYLNRIRIILYLRLHIHLNNTQFIVKIAEVKSTEMAEGLKVRNISPFLQMMRNFLLGRKHVPERASLRYTALVADRDQPPPNLPEGDQHQLSSNPYHKRDGRREALPPHLILESSSVKKLSTGSSLGQEETKKKVITPGKYWDCSGIN